MANPEHLEVLKRGFDAWNQWREKLPPRRPDLSGACLSSAHLSRADLRGACFDEADLRRASLCRARLVGADLAHAVLDGADLSHAVIGDTIFATVDLSAVRGLEGAWHLEPSTISTDLAELYEVAPRVLLQAVKRNRERLEAVIAKDRTVRDLKEISGNRMLVEAAYMRSGSGAIGPPFSTECQSRSVPTSTSTSGSPKTLGQRRGFSDRRALLRNRRLLSSGLRGVATHPKLHSVSARSGA